MRCRTLRGTPCDGVLDGPPQLPVAVDFDEHALRDPVLDHVDEEERIAARPLVEATHQPVGHAVPGKRLGKIPADVCSRETPERKVAAESAQRQIVLHRGDRMLSRHDIRRPIGPDHQEPSGLVASGQE